MCNWICFFLSSSFNHFKNWRHWSLLWLFRLSTYTSNYCTKNCLTKRLFFTNNINKLNYYKTKFIKHNTNLYKKWNDNRLIKCTLAKLWYYYIFRIMRQLLIYKHRCCCKLLYNNNVLESQLSYSLVNWK